MVKFAIVFISFASVIYAQSQQIQQRPDPFPVGPGTGGPGEGGPFGGTGNEGPGEGGPFSNNGRFNRVSPPPFILGPGPVIGGNGQPFNGQGFGNGNNQNGQNPLNRFPFTDNDAGNPQTGGFRQAGSVIENRNNLPNTYNNNGFPSIAGPGPVIVSGSTPFPPITAGAALNNNNRKKRAAAASASKKPVVAPSASTSTTTGTPRSPLNNLENTNRGGHNVPAFGNVPQQQGGSFPGFGAGQHGSFGFPGQNQNGFGQSGFGFPDTNGQQSGFPGSQNNNGFNNGQQQQFPSWPGQPQQPFPGFQNGNNGFDNNFGFGQNGFNNGQFGFGQTTQTPTFGGFPNAGQQSGFGFPGNQGTNNGFPNNNGQQSGFPFNGQNQNQRPGSFGSPVVAN